MPSELQLVNDALSLIGKPAVSSISETPQAQYFANKIATLHPELLLADNWIFASVYTENSTPVSPNYSQDYTYTFQLPVDFGRFFRWAQSSLNPIDYQFADGYLLCNQSPIYYWYIVNDAAYEILPPLYAKALTHYAASESCLVLTNNAGLTKYLEGQYAVALNNAIKYNQTQRPIVQSPYNDYQRTYLV